MKVRDLVIQALLGAILFAVQVALSPLPNIELVSILCLVYTLTFGVRALGAIYVFVLLEGLLYGFGLWWIMYLYVWAILWGIAMLLRRYDSWLLWSFVLGFYGLAFGALCTIPYFFVGGVGTAVAWWINGIPFDIVHCLGNFASGLMLYRPLILVMKKLASLQRRA